ncbi:hypothetical protein [Oceanobacillus kimchii]|uniref:hypothetical protein n=1 Tax=Oceanobacillus kimchii TaxID=746691 RepID=UPI003B02675E
MKNKNYRLNRFALEVEGELRKHSFEEQYYYENQYLYYHNYICPLCKKSMKLNIKGVLSSYGLIGLIHLEKEKVALSYALCKKCSKSIANNTMQTREEYKHRISIHIVETIKKDFR